MFLSIFMSASGIDYPCRTQSNKAFLLDIKADDLSEVDVGSLEAAAKAAGSQPDSTATPTATTA